MLILGGAIPWCDVIQDPNAPPPFGPGPGRGRGAPGGRRNFGDEFPPPVSLLCYSLALLQATVSDTSLVALMQGFNNSGNMFG